MTTAQTEAVESKGAVILLQEELQAVQEDAQRQRTQYELALAQLDRERGMAQAEFQQCNSLLAASGRHVREKKDEMMAMKAEMDELWQALQALAPTTPPPPVDPPPPPPLCELCYEGVALLVLARLARRHLKAGRVDVVIQAARALCKGRNSAGIRTEVDYFVDRKDRMRYSAYRRRGIPLGSGAVESAIRRVIKQRCIGIACI